MKKEGFLIYGSSSYAALTKDITRIGGFVAGRVERKSFADGERYQRIAEDVSGRDVVVVGGTISDTEVLEIFDLACALVHYGAATLTLIIPYFGYSTMERAVKEGEVVTAKNRARLFSSIPLASNGNRLAMIDLHSEGIPHYFEGSMHPVHLYAKQVILSTIGQIGRAEFVIACTDAGRAKWVESLANDLSVRAAFVFKRRLGDRQTEVTAVSAQVAERQVIIYDDMIRTGGSLKNAARAYLQAGASEISAIATHGIFPGDALQRLQDCGLFREIVCTDTHPRVLELQNDFLRVESIAGLVVDFLKASDF